MLNGGSGEHSRRAGDLRTGSALTSAPRATGSARSAHAARSEGERAAGSHKLPTSPVIASAAMQRLYALLERVAHAQLPVLVLGETGVGKEVAARALHERGARAAAPFVAINCASVPSALIESVLFGHEKGAFTGASERRPGMFEQAAHGTIFLDEVGELTPPVQAALLRVLETKRVTPIGASKELEVDVRVVAATHRDLAAMVANGSFREDLMFRLDALTLTVPPLRDRREEIEPLVERFLAQARARGETAATGISSQARAALRAYRWPGNVRQLKHVIERAALVCSGDRIELADLPEALFASAARAPGRAPQPTPADDTAEHDPSRSLKARVLAFEKRLIREALASAQGNQTKAAALLKVPRRTLTHRIHVLGVTDE